MPKYRNSTGMDITVGSLRFPARSAMEVESFLETVPAGLTLDSVAPQYNEVLMANKYNAATGADIATIVVPDNPTGGGYSISFYVESGEFQIRFNEAAMTPPIRITEGQTWTHKYGSKVVEDIRIHCVTGGWIYVNIHKA